jgi:hypothetical protein
VKLTILAEYPDGCDGKAQRQFRGQRLVGLSAYAIGPEESAH